MGGDIHCEPQPPPRRAASRSLRGITRGLRKSLPCKQLALRLAPAVGSYCRFGKRGLPDGVSAAFELKSATPYPTGVVGHVARQ